MKELLYLKIYAGIRDDIISGKLPVGTRIKGIRDLAKEWSSSANTVLRALDALAAEGLIKKVQGSGIFVEKDKLQEDAGTSISDIEMFIYNLEVPFNQALVTAVEKAASEFSYNLQIKTFTSLKKIDIPVNKAVIILPPAAEEKYSNIDSTGKLPLIFTGEFSPPTGFCYNYAVADTYGGFFQLAEHLVKSGRRRISYIGAKEELDQDAGWNAYFDVCSGIHSGYCREYSVSSGGWSIEAGKAAMERLLLSEEYPDAVICRNDTLTAGAMEACKKAGILIPDDIIFATGSSQGLAPLLDPPPLSIKIPAYSIGLSVVSHIDNHLKGRTLPGLGFKAKFILELFQSKPLGRNKSSEIDELYWI